MRSRMSHTAVKVIEDGKAVFAVHEWGNDGAHEPTECPKARFMGHIFEQSPDGQGNATSFDRNLHLDVGRNMSLGTAACRNPRAAHAKGYA
jgi:hypothetical protein